MKKLLDRFKNGPFWVEFQLLPIFGFPQKHRLSSRFFDPSFSSVINRFEHNFLLVDGQVKKTSKKIGEVGGGGDSG